MNFSFLMMTIIIALTSSISGCKNRRTNNQTSKLGSGHFRETGGLNKSLINVPPGADLIVCGKPERLIKETANAIRMWASAGYRDQFLTIKTTSDCPHANATVNVIKVSDDPANSKPDDDPNATDDCTKFYGNIYASAIRSSPHKITLCKEIGSEFNSIVLHEVGHLWGLCDQYLNRTYANEPGVVTFCDSINSNRVADIESAMSNNFAEKLSNADIWNIQSAMIRTDIPVNAEWKKILQERGLIVQPKLPPSAEVLPEGRYFYDPAKNDNQNFGFADISQVTFDKNGLIDSLWISWTEARSRQQTDSHGYPISILEKPVGEPLEGKAVWSDGYYKIIDKEGREFKTRLLVLDRQRLYIDLGTSLPPIAGLPDPNARILIFKK